MSKVLNPVKNCFAFQCNCGYERMVVDTEVNFRCERPIVDASEKKCSFFYQKVNDGGGAGIPTVHRVDSSGNNQNDDATVISSDASDQTLVSGDDTATNAEDGLGIAADGVIG